MNVNTTYVAVRDDKSHRSLSLNEQNFLRQGAHAPTILRLDGRRGDEIRKVRLRLGRWDNGAECTVHWGAGTRVTAMCTAQLVPPLPDRPNEGMVNFSVDLSPMAGTAFRQAPSVSTAPMGSSTVVARASNFSDKSQRLLSNQILRSVERIILLGGALDSEALVLIPGSWVWRINISLTVMDDGGNILDACVLAAVATLRHYRKPHVDVQNSDAGSTELPTLIPSNVKEPTPLPLHHSPLSISFALIPANESTTVSEVSTLVDPEKREELVQFGTLTIAMNQHMEVCLLDYGGGYELSVQKLKECLRTASSSIKHLCQELENALEQADEVAQKEMLRLLQRRNNQSLPLEMDREASQTLQTPFLQTNLGDMSEPVAVEQSSEEAIALEQATTEAEEAYRQQALDYSLGHVASAVREDEGPKPTSASQKASSLFHKLLKAADSNNATTPAELEDKMPVVEKMIDAEPEAMETEEDPKPKSAQLGTKVQHEAASTDVAMAAAVDDDEEEETTFALSSEFQSAPEEPSKALPPQPPSEDPAPDDIDDLAMAVKKKKKGGKKDGKKKK